MNAANLAHAAGNPTSRLDEGSTPLREKMNRLRRCLVEAVSVDAMGAIANALIRRAAEGHFAAAKLYLGYLFGSPGRCGIADNLDDAEAIPAPTTVTQRRESAPTTVTQRGESAPTTVTQRGESATVAEILPALVSPELEQLFHQTLTAEPIDLAGRRGAASSSHRSDCAGRSKK